LARLANATQFVFDLMMQSNSKWCLKNLPSRNLIITGGCALNRQAVDTIRPNWANVYVPPNPGDPGSCIGAVLALNKKHIDFKAETWYNSK
jgi:carbamoyltransferase